MSSVKLRSPNRSPLHQLWQRLESIPLPEPEDSVVLRILVQVAVAIGIISIDVAAADVADPLWISPWAVSVSIVGAAWSWYRRRHRNVPVKFCIAIAMLLALAVFFVRLVSESNDTRLALAELLIWLQVFHSFDLPRRKDLGYSMVIGLILIGVSATLSQTLVFAPLLVLFLVVSVPVLILDYRSRLGLAPHSIKQPSLDLAPRRLVIFLLVTVGLGLLIFACLPRLPGYQLRTFPVSSPIDFQGEFQAGTIINPGYVREGRTTEGFGAGGNGDAEVGPGELNNEFYYGFNDRINQNLRGALKPQVVMRVRSQAEGFWRVMAFDRYTGQGWEVSRNSDDQVQKIERPGWSFRFNLPWSVTINRTREVVQSYTIVADLPNLIPVLYEPKELYFPTRQVAIDQEGSLRSPVSLSEGLTYTVVSEVPYRNRTLLRQAQAQIPRAANNLYLQVPSAVAERVKAKTKEILSAANPPLTSPYEKALYLAQYLKQNYSIQPDLPFLEDDEDLVSAFLFKYEGGYPDHFSTVLTVMLRSVGIPARLVVGFAPGEFNPFTGFYVVRNTDAFAMTEVYFSKYGWFTFNPIPGMEVIPPSVEDYETFGILRRFWNWIAGFLPSPMTGFLTWVVESILSGLTWAIAALSSLFSRGWVGLLLGLGVLICLSFLAWLGISGWRTWRYRRWLAKMPPMAALYRQMVDWLAAQGVSKPASQTPLEYAQHVQQQQSRETAAVVDEISQAYVQWRYGGHPPNLSYLRQRFTSLKKRRRDRSNSDGSKQWVEGR
jgi:transglutaminase-like putative cysteine protease